MVVVMDVQLSHEIPIICDELTHWGLVTPYVDKDMDQHWLR